MTSRGTIDHRSGTTGTPAMLPLALDEAGLDLAQACPLKLRKYRPADDSITGHAETHYGRANYPSQGSCGRSMNTAEKIPDDGGRPRPAAGRRQRISLGAFTVIVTLIAGIHLGFWALRDPDTTAAQVEDRLTS